MIKMMVPAVAVVAALAASNPREDAHARQMVVAARDNCGLLCGGAVALASGAVHYDDYLLFSTAELGETRTVGALGRVMITSPGEK